MEKQVKTKLKGSKYGAFRGISKEENPKIKPNVRLYELFHNARRMKENFICTEVI